MSAEENKSPSQMLIKMAALTKSEFRESLMAKSMQVLIEEHMTMIEQYDQMKTHYLDRIRRSEEMRAKAENTVLEKLIEEWNHLLSTEQQTGFLLECIERLLPAVEAHIQNSTVRMKSMPLIIASALIKGVLRWENKR